MLKNAKNLEKSWISFGKVQLLVSQHVSEEQGELKGEGGGGQTNLRGIHPLPPCVHLWPRNGYSKGYETPYILFFLLFFSQAVTGGCYRKVSITAN